MKKTALALLIILIGISLMGVFKVNEYQVGVVLRFQKPIRTITTPGLKFKIPVIDTFQSYDARILGYDSDPREIYTQDKKNLVIDNYAKWRIVDPKIFLETVTNERGAQIVLDATIYSELRKFIGRYSLEEIVGVERESIMEQVTKESNAQMGEIGVEVLDVRIKRVDLPQQNEENVYNRMKAGRQKEATQYRYEGRAEAQLIRAEADRNRIEVESGARKDAEKTRGEGDAEALKIYADAFNTDPEFFEFIRTLEAYEKMFSGRGQNTVILSADGNTWKMLQENK